MAKNKNNPQQSTKQLLGIEGITEYSLKGSISVKLGKLQSAMTAGLEQLRKPSQTAAELKITARKLYYIADCALRFSTEEMLVQQAEQKETSEEVPSDEQPFSQVMSL